MVDVGCPTVEKDYEKLVTIHTANKAPTQLSHFVAIPWTFSPRAPGLPSEHVKETDRMQCSDSVPVQFGRVWYMLCTVLPFEPAVPCGPDHRRSPHRCS